MDSDLRANAAAAAVKLKEWDLVVEATSSVLKVRAPTPPAALTCRTRLHGTCCLLLTVVALTRQAEPTHAKALFRRATAYEAQGEHVKARGDLETLLEAQPRNAAARKMLEGLPEAQPVLV